MVNLSDFPKVRDPNENGELTLYEFSQFEDPNLWIQGGTKMGMPVLHTTNNTALITLNNRNGSGNKNEKEIKNGNKQHELVWSTHDR